MPQDVKDKLGELLKPFARMCEEDLRRWATPEGTPRALAEAMEYCLFGGGKRLRPALVHLAAEAVGGDGADESVRRAATAVEMIHTYSLVHDDLPAMDNDDLRRGRPTAHVRYGEAMAILAGDALLTRGLGLLAEAPNHAAELAAELASAAGCAGMIAGQVADMGLCELPDGAEGLRFIHVHKTAELIRCSVRMGALAGGADAAQLDALSRYGRQLGLAFQALDDLLDVTGDAESLGKTPGKDAQAGKATYVAELGLPGAGKHAQELTRSALAALTPLGDRAAKLTRLGRLLGQRTR